MSDSYRDKIQPESHYKLSGNRKTSVQYVIEHLFFTFLSRLDVKDGGFYSYFADSTLISFPKRPHK